MKKIIIFLTIFVLVFSLAGCRTYEEAREQGGDWAEGYFTVIKAWGDLGARQYMIVYANDTKVMYYIDAYSVAGGMTPLYNADGTLQVYDGE